MPDWRMLRHDGNPDAVSLTSPSDLYSNSTVALDPKTGKLAWYYQHLPTPAFIPRFARCGCGVEAPKLFASQLPPAGVLGASLKE
jgi:hypothetical protein